MKQRIVYPSMWRDTTFSQLSKNARYLTTYLINNEQLSLSRYTKIPPRVMAFDTGLTEREIDEAKTELTASGLFSFSGDWIYHHHTYAYVDYHGNTQVERAREKEEEQIPESVKIELTSVSEKNCPDGVQTASEQRSDITRNKKLETINQKPEKTYTVDNLTLEQVAERINQAFDLYLGKKFKGIEPFKANLAYWLDTYEPKEVAQAIQNAKYDKFWKDKLTPVILFRRKNPSGEPVDHIGRLLNSKEDSWTN